MSEKVGQSMLLRQVLILLRDQWPNFLRKKAGLGTRFNLYLNEARIWNAMCDVIGSDW